MEGRLFWKWPVP